MSCCDGFCTGVCGLPKHERKDRRVTEIIPPPVLYIAIQRALKLPAMAVARQPLPGGGWHVGIQRIA